MSNIKQVRFNIADTHIKPIISKKRNVKPANLKPSRKSVCKESAIKAHNIGKFTEQYLSANLTPFQELYLVFILEQQYLRNRVQNNRQHEFIVFIRWLRIKNPNHEIPSREQFINLLSTKSDIITHINFSIS